MPTSNFFNQCLNRKNFLNLTIELHNVVTSQKKKKEIIYSLIKKIIQLIMDKIFEVREQEEENWTQNPTYANLPYEQKILLDKFYSNIRATEVKWLEKILSNISEWVLFTYTQNIGDEAVDLGDAEWRFVTEIVREVADENMEFYK